MKKLIAAGSALACLFALGSQAQSRKSAKKPVKPAAQATPTPESTPEPRQSVPGKRNGRPDAVNGSSDNTATPYQPNYFYEFERPGFTYSRILMEHDSAGKGKISFMPDGSDEMFTDPLELTPVTLENINAAIVKLDFLNSNEVYQTAHDYSNMGNITFTYKNAGREREVKYNWSENKAAKALMDEYRRISNEYTWKFEMTVARENQPLQTPGLMDQLDSYLARNEISDPPHLVPLLSLFENDERLPLIARNHAGKLIKEIKKK
jgi:hypothetical protein